MTVENKPITNMKNQLKKEISKIRRSVFRNPEIENPGEVFGLICSARNLRAQINLETTPEIEAMRTAEDYKNNGLTALLPNNEDTYGSKREVDFGCGYRLHVRVSSCDVELEAWDKEIVKTSGHTGDMEKPL